MGDASEEQGAPANVDHGLGDVQALLVVAHQAAPTGHPAEGALHHPAPRQDLEADLVGQLAHDFEDEVVVGRRTRQLAPVIGAVSEQVPQPVVSQSVV